MILKLNIERVESDPKFEIQAGYICHLRGAAYFDAPQHYSAPTPELAVARSMAACAHDLARNRVTKIERHGFTDAYWGSEILESIDADPLPA